MYHFVINWIYSWICYVMNSIFVTLSSETYFTRKRKEKMKLCVSSTTGPCFGDFLDQTLQQMVAPANCALIVGHTLRHFEVWDKYILKYKTNTFWNLRQNTFCYLKQIQFDTNTFWNWRQIHCEVSDLAGGGASQVRTYCRSQPRISSALKESSLFCVW